MTDDGAPVPGWVVRAAVAPLVPAVVLATHVAGRRSEDLTPWKGGGFGMFSTVDSPAGRVVRVELHTDLGVLPLALPPGLRSRAGVARAAPSTDRLAAPARAVAERWWVVPAIAAPELAGAASRAGSGAGVGAGAGAASGARSGGGAGSGAGGSTDRAAGGR